MTKPWRHHSHNRVEIAVEAHFPPQYFGSRTKVAAHKSVADYYRLEKSRRSIFRRVDAPPSSGFAPSNVK